jgi:hypothetical protein
VNSVYRHTQTSNLHLFLILPAAAGLGALFAVQNSAHPAPPLMFAPFAALLLVVYLFSSLTIEITQDELIWFFGPGVWRKRMALADIASATPARNKWWWGWGIRLTPRGWLYNVGGLNAVEIMSKSGKTFRLGTDDAPALAAALSPRQA